MLIEFIDETDSVSEEYINTIKALLHFAKEQEEVVDHAELSISFVTNPMIQELNRNYRNIDQPTDVISFAIQESAEDEITITGDYLPPLTLGDIVISIDQAQEQAKTYQHSLKREYGFLALHGFLHLLGYDHKSKAEEEVMFTKQEDILNAFGLSRE